MRHYLAFHRYIFQDLYDWAGEPRKMNIVKEEPALGGLSVEYTDYPDIRKRLAEVLRTMRRRPWEKYDLDKLTKCFSHDLACSGRFTPSARAIRARPSISAASSPTSMASRSTVNSLRRTATTSAQLWWPITRCSQTSETNRRSSIWK